MNRARALRGLLAVAVLAGLGVAALHWLGERIGVEGWSVRTAPVANRGINDVAIRERFATYSKGLDSKAYEAAFQYLLEGFVNYRSPGGARVHYPGTPSRNGRTSDGLEGFARFFPVAASWIASGRSDTVELGGRRVSIEGMLREGLLAGTRRGGPEFWGVITSNNQRLVESADVALGLWLSREQLWAKLAPPEREQVATWLRRALVVDAYEGNWALFPILVSRVLAALGEDVCCDEIVLERYWRQFKQLAMGGGWVADGMLGADYYNAWAMQYVMFWLDQIDPAFDPEFIRRSNREIVAFYQYLMSPRGAPLMGRSVCYRMATPVPLLTAQVLSPGVVTPGRAMRALDAAWGWFVTHGAVADGVITQGFCGKDLALVNDYTAPASCLWGARGLIVAMYLDPSLRLLDMPREPLPVEIADFAVSEKSIGWTVRGSKDRGEVVLTVDANSPGSDQPAFQPYTRRHALLEWLTHRPRRPNNHDALYNRREYSTDQKMTRCEPALR